VGWVLDESGAANWLSRRPRVQQVYTTSSIPSLCITRSAKTRNSNEKGNPDLPSESWKDVFLTQHLQKRYKYFLDRITYTTSVVPWVPCERFCAFEGFAIGMEATSRELSGLVESELRIEGGSGCCRRGGCDWYVDGCLGGSC